MKDDIEIEWNKGFHKKPPLVENATNQLMKKYKFLTIEETEEILYYRDGVYVTGGQKLIEKETEVIYWDALKNSDLVQIIGHIKRRTYHKHEELDPDINIINLKNGLYDVEKDLLLEHTPDYLSVNQKNIVFNKEAKPKRFLKFLQEVLYPQEILTAIDVYAYTFHRDYPIETIFMLYGNGSNGKTVYTSVLTALHGTRNVSNVPLLEMLGDRFALSDLEDKALNIDNEISGQTIKEASVLKRLTGGSRQQIRIQRKNQVAYDTMLYAKLLFNANRVPDSQDISDAFNRRVTIISFPKRFEGVNEDKQLLSKLTTEEELSGIFNILMRALRRILRTKELYLNDKTIEEKRIKYERAVNPIKSFKDEAVIRDEDNYTPKTDFYQAYIQYCKKYSLPMERYDPFCKILMKEFGFEDTRPTINDARVWCWKHLILNPDYAPKTEQKKLEELI